MDKKENKPDYLDVLGPLPKRSKAFTGNLLSEVEDEELNAIVAEVAQAVGVPIALVNFVLEEIQFFKAHYGLPPELQATRATSRDAAFCQYVVRDEELFEVNDAGNDERIPQRLVKAFNLKAYLGVPIYANDIVVGSLCVIDLKPRQFSTADYEKIKAFGLLVNKRLAVLSRQKKLLFTRLLEKSMSPSLREIQEALQPLESESASGLVALEEMKVLVRQMEYILAAGKPSYQTMTESLRVARNAIESCRNSFYNINMSVADIEDAISALGTIFPTAGPVQLRDIAMAGRELSHASTQSQQGIFLGDVSFNPIVLSTRPVAVAVLSNCLLLMVAKLDAQGSKSKIKMDFVDLKDQKGGIMLSTPVLSSKDFAEIEKELKTFLGFTPGLKIQLTEAGLILSFVLYAEKD